MTPACIQVSNFQKWRPWFHQPALGPVFDRHRQSTWVHETCPEVGNAPTHRCKWVIVLNYFNFQWVAFKFCPWCVLATSLIESLSRHTITNLPKSALKVVMFRKVWISPHHQPDVCAFSHYTLQNRLMTIQNTYKFTLLV